MNNPQISSMKNISVYGQNASLTSSTSSYWTDLYNISNNVSLNTAMTVVGLYTYSNNGTGYIGSQYSKIINGYAHNNQSNGFTLTSSDNVNINANDNGNFGINASVNVTKIDGLTTSGNSAGGVSVTGKLFLNNATINEATKITTSIEPGIFAYVSRFSTYKALIHSNNAIVVQDSTAQLHGAASISWKHDPTTAHNSDIPVVQPLQPFAVNGSALVTFKIWVYRTSTNVEGRVRLRGYVTPGVDADVTATITAAINTWQELTVTCTPSAAGVVQIDLESYSVNGSTGTVYFGDATVSQA